MSVEVFDTPDGLAGAAARAFAEKSREAIAARGSFAVALAGGSTPKATYEVLARDHADTVDWPSVHVFFGDERPVPPEHEDSNYRMAGEALLDHVPVGSVHRMRGELPPEEAASSYEEELRVFFGEDPPVLDLVMLGIGEDGHTASLFPETSALEVTGRLAVANPVPKLGTTRITLTVPVLNAARDVLMLVAGEGKAEALEEILEGEDDPRAYPAKLVQPSGGPRWLVDRSAARKLQNLNEY
ncbi:MAG TPA: 6-phosphogluconolactonase [Rubrobacter sp.]|nr:6-phosphogluconolactonase [Rubrobacter sp.]